MGRGEGMKGGGRRRRRAEMEAEVGEKGKVEGRGLKRTGDYEEWEERWRKGEKVVVGQGRANGG